MSQAMNASLPSHSTVDVSSKQLIKQAEYQLRELARTPDVVISSLAADSHTYSRYVRAFNIVKRFYQTATAEEYEELIRFIDTLPRPARIETGTFGSYIFGCLYDVPKDGNFNCSPTCANSIPPHNGAIEACSSQVWYVRDGDLVYRSGSGSEAVVFQSSPTLSNAQWRQLRSNGVNRVTLYSPSGEALAVRDIPDNLPQTDIGTGETPMPIVTTAATANAISSIAQASTTGVQRGSLSFFNDWRLIIILLVVIILIGILVYFVYTMLKKGDAKLNEEKTVVTTTQTTPTTPQVVQ